MMLSKSISYDHSITELGHIQVRQIVRILEDGVEISKTHHRHVLSPGENVDTQDDRSKLIAGVIWTPSVLAKYKEEVAKQEAM